jgi:hypothetical protein
LSINYLSQALPAFAILGWLAEVYPELSRIAGGGLVNSWLSQGSLAGSDSFGGLLHALVPGRGEDSLSAWIGMMPVSPSMPPMLPAVPPTVIQAPAGLANRILMISATLVPVTGGHHPVFVLHRLPLEALYLLPRKG